VQQNTTKKTNSTSNNTSNKTSSANPWINLDTVLEVL
jgi:hypothetical protein